MQVEEVEKLAAVDDEEEPSGSKGTKISDEEVEKSYGEMAFLLVESAELFKTIRRGLIKRQDKGDRSVKKLIEDVASIETDIEMYIENELITWS